MIKVGFGERFMSNCYLTSCRCLFEQPEFEQIVQIWHNEVYSLQTSPVFKLLCSTLCTFTSVTAVAASCSTSIRIVILFCLIIERKTESGLQLLATNSGCHPRGRSHSVLNNYKGSQFPQSSLWYHKIFEQVQENFKTNLLFKWSVCMDGGNMSQFSFHQYQSTRNMRY